MSQKIISFHYTLTDTDGVVVESSQGRDPVSFMTEMGMIVPGLERELIHYATGQKGRVEVKAEDAYGLIDFAKYVQVPLEALPRQEIKVGDMFQSNQSPVPFTVKEVAEAHVILDGNHPLAGEDLVFDVEVLEVRDASAQELQQLQEMMQAAQQQQQQAMQQAQQQQSQPPEATA